MFTILFLILALFLFFKLIGFMFRVSFGIGKLILAIIFWPIILLIAIIGLAWLALPILIIIGVVLLIVKAATRV